MRTNLKCAECPYFYECGDREKTGALPPYRPGAYCRRQYVVRATLFDGRHETPATVPITVWHDSVPDVMDFDTLETQADTWVRGRFKGEPGLLVLYVTGLTQALMAVVKACYKNGVHLTCMHYDKIEEKYQMQIIF